MEKKRDGLVFFLRLVLGCLFLLASIDKVISPGNFFNLLSAYQLLPLSLTGLAAGTLPWIELIVGLCLVSGLAVRSSAFLSLLLLLGFLAALIFNYFRGHIIDCGCYTVLFRYFGLEERISLFTIFRDLAIWFIALVVFLFDQGHWGLGRWMTRMIHKDRLIKISPVENRKT